MCDDYLNRAVTLDELRGLALLAKEEESAFFQRNPHLAKPYHDRLILIALCQGAALQYIGAGYGVKDFDIHFFYAQNPAKPKLSRAVKRVHTTVGSFPERPIDFIRTVIPDVDMPFGPNAIIKTVQEFLLTSPTANAWHLSQKAVVGLSPDDLHAVQVWPSA